MFLTCPEKSKDLAIPHSYGNRVSGARSERKDDVGQGCEPGQSSEQRGQRSYWIHKWLWTQEGVKSLETAHLSSFPNSLSPSKWFALCSSHICSLAQSRISLL